ncbi:MAG: hypothetical protein H6679_01725 [Epsilonproteobacteria bacterium]|nr:hypothetical protein [Campylobacterota bacterium]
MINRFSKALLLAMALTVGTRHQVQAMNSSHTQVQAQQNQEAWYQKLGKILFTGGFFLAGAKNIHNAYYNHNNANKCAKDAITSLKEAKKIITKIQVIKALSPMFYQTENVNSYMNKSAVMSTIQKDAFIPIGFQETRALNSLISNAIDNINIKSSKNSEAYLRCIHRTLEALRNERVLLVAGGIAACFLYYCKRTENAEN